MLEDIHVSYNISILSFLVCIICRLDSKLNQVDKNSVCIFFGHEAHWIPIHHVKSWITIMKLDSLPKLTVVSHFFCQLCITTHFSFFIWFITWILSYFEVWIWYDILPHFLNIRKIVHVFGLNWIKYMYLFAYILDPREY